MKTIIKMASRQFVYVVVVIVVFDGVRGLLRSPLAEPLMEHMAVLG